MPAVEAVVVTDLDATFRRKICNVCAHAAPSKAPSTMDGTYIPAGTGRGRARGRRVVSVSVKSASRRVRTWFVSAAEEGRGQVGCVALGRLLGRGEVLEWC